MEFVRFEKDEDKKYTRIGAGIAMSSARAGFITVIGETKETGFQGKRKLVQLEEFESFDDRELVERMSWLNYKYQPVTWYGDIQDVQLDSLLEELNKEISYDNVTRNRSQIKIDYAVALCGRNDATPYKTVMAQLNQLLGGVARDPQRQRLFISAGKLKTYLQTPSQEEAFTMQFRDFPAIDSLAFAVFGLIDAEERRDRPPQQEFAEDSQVL